MQVSGGHLTNPEAAEPGNVTRLTGMLAYETATPGGSLAVSLITGRNEESGEVAWGTLLEWNWVFGRWNTIYGRLEAVDRDLYVLTLQAAAARRACRPTAPASTPRRSATRADFPVVPFLQTGLGADVTLYGFTKRLDPVYSRNPVSFHAFLRIAFEVRRRNGLTRHALTPRAPIAARTSRSPPGVAPSLWREATRSSARTGYQLRRLSSRGR